MLFDTQIIQKMEIREIEGKDHNFVASKTALVSYNPPDRVILNINSEMKNWS